MEPLSALHLAGLTALWSDPAVIRYTNVEEPCGESAAALRLEKLGFVRTAVHSAAFQREGQALDIWDYARALGIKRRNAYERKAAVVWL